MTLRALTRLASLACALPIAAAAADWDLVQVRNTYEDATVFIEIVADGKVRETGSGVVLTETGFVLSAKHLLDCCRPGGTYWARSSALPGRVELKLIDEESKHDLALFQLALPSPWKGRKLPSIGGPVEAGRPLFALGYPLSREEYPYLGLPGTLLGNLLADGRWQTDLPLTYGNSGGPVFDVSGALVAVALSGVKGEPGQNFVAPIKLAERLLRAARVQLPDSFGMPAPDLFTLLIDASGIKGPSDQIEALLDAVRNVGNDLRAIRIARPGDQANYTLKLQELRSFNGNFLRLDAVYDSPGKQAQPVAGKCSTAGCRSREGPDVAFKDLLENTLLHPLYGFYRQMSIESCDSVRDSVVSLNVKWSKGAAGLTDKDSIYYEVGELTGGEGESPNPTSYYVDVNEVLKRDTSWARVRFNVLGTGSYSLRVCQYVGRASNEVLMVRLKPRSFPETRANSNPSSFVSQNR